MQKTLMLQHVCVITPSQLNSSCYRYRYKHSIDTHTHKYMYTRKYLNVEKLHTLAYTYYTALRKSQCHFSLKSALRAYSVNTCNNPDYNVITFSVYCGLIIDYDALERRSYICGTIWRTDVYYWIFKLSFGGLSLLDEKKTGPWMRNWKWQIIMNQKVF